MLPKSSTYVKSYDVETKLMNFFNKGTELFKIRSYRVETPDFHSRKIPEADSTYIWCLVVSINSALKNDEKYYSQVFL